MTKISHPEILTQENRIRITNSIHLCENFDKTKTCRMRRKRMEGMEHASQPVYVK